MNTAPARPLAAVGGALAKEILRCALEAAQVLRASLSLTERNLQENTAVQKQVESTVLYKRLARPHSIDFLLRTVWG